MWATARSDHGLSWAEFQSLTLSQFEALEERRAIRVRYERFNAALITATLFNAHRSAEAPPLEVWDFIAGFETPPEERQRQDSLRELRRSVNRALTRVATEPMERVREVTERVIKRLEENGVSDPKDFIREIFPSMEI